MHGWLATAEECKKALITHLIISKQLTRDWALGGTKQEVQTYENQAVAMP